MRFPMKTLALTLGLLAKMNTSVNAEKVDIEAVKTEIGELKSSGEWSKGASASTIAYLTSIGQWPLKTSEGNTVASAGHTPANDLCADATEITSFPFTSSGDTTDATTETGIDDCGTSYDNAPAVWYKVTGTGLNMLAKTVEPFGYDTKLHVFSGSCGAFTCVGGNDDGVGLLSTVAWGTVAGVDYYIMVHGFGSSRGAYNLRVTEHLPTPNDVCADATEIMTLPFSSSGDTNFASPETGLPEDCGTSYTNAPAVWYKVFGTGGSMTAETVSPEYYDTKLHVFSGSCGAFNCIDGNDDGGASTLSKVTWDSVPCEEYYILVHGYSSSQVSSSRGEYNLDVTSDATIPVCHDEQCKIRDPENDVCAELNGDCKVDCEDDENFICVPNLCSYDRNWDKPTKSPKTTKSPEMRALMDEVDVVDIEVTADGHTERKLKATKAPSEKETKTTKAPKATKAPKSSCACRVPRSDRCNM